MDDGLDTPVDAPVIPSRVDVEDGVETIELDPPVDAPVIPSTIELEELIVVGSDTTLWDVPVDAPENPALELVATDCTDELTKVELGEVVDSMDEVVDSMDEVVESMDEMLDSTPVEAPVIPSTIELEELVVVGTGILVVVGTETMVWLVPVDAPVYPAFELVSALETELSAVD